jgi:hypothetical protein
VGFQIWILGIPATSTRSGIRVRRAIAGGVDPIAVQRVLGHTTPEMVRLLHDADADADAELLAAWGHVVPHARRRGGDASDRGWRATPERLIPQGRDARRQCGCGAEYRAAAAED